MSLSPQTVLVTILDHYDATGDPLSVEALAEVCGVRQAELTPVLESLCQVEFIVATGSGYRPAVTGREFLQLDVELCDVVAVDAVDT